MIRNDELTVDEIRALKPSRIILSPGPGFPKDAGICIEAAKTLGKEIPTLGVCLGHQAICEAYGATVSYAKELMHGKQSTITIDEICPIFQGMGNTMKAARYHSLAAVKETIPETLKVTAKIQRRRSYGSYASGVPHLRCTVPSRTHPDTRWKNHIE